MFHLDLLKKNEKVTINFQENETKLGQKWSKALRDEIDKGITIPQPNRIYNLNDEWSERKVCKAINKCIDIINAHDKIIDFRLKNSMTQDDSNKLHHFFEIMRGENDEPNEYYLRSPKHVREAIEEYNVLIHRWEDLWITAPDGTKHIDASYRRDNAKRNIWQRGRIVVHISDRPMFEMEDGDWDCWTLKYNPGDIRINYCHKGKPIMDVIKDGDEVIGEDNITPQHRYSADFSLGFNYGFGHFANWTPIIDGWWKQNEQFMQKLGYTKDNPKSAIGQGVVGRIQGSAFLTKAKIFGSTKILDVRYS